MMYRSSLKMLCLASQNGDNSSSPVRERWLGRARGRLSARESEALVVSLLFLPGQSAAGPLFRQLSSTGSVPAKFDLSRETSRNAVEAVEDGMRERRVDVFEVVNAGMRGWAETTMEETTRESRALEVRRSLGGRISFC